MNKQIKIFQADVQLREAIEKHHIDLGVLVAETGIWANPKVHRYLLEENGTGAWRPNTRRAQSGEERRTEVEGILLDDNSYANNYIKAAVGLTKKQIVGYETCHIWPRTCYQPDYHTAIANLVLLPRALASLTDHSNEILAVLQYRSYELYGFHPVNSEIPARPANYPHYWLEAMPFNERVKQSLLRRKWAIGRNLALPSESIATDLGR